MGKRGPKPRNASQKRAQGYKTAGESTPMPKPRGLTGEALEEWHRIVAALTDAGRLFALHFSSIHTAAYAWGEMLKLQKQIVREGATYEVGDMIKQNPAVSAMNIFSNIHTVRMEKLGLTAHAMKRSGETPGTPDDPKDEMDSFKAERPQLKVNHG